MTVNDLIFNLRRAVEINPQSGDALVVIPNSIKQIGPKASVPVENIFFGFDWDKGKCFIYPCVDMIKKPEL